MLARILKFKYNLVLFSVALTCLAFPPFNLPFLVFVSLVPWLRFLRACNAREAWRSGLLFGSAFMLMQNSWMIQFVGRWTGSLAMGAIPWILTLLVLIWWFGFFGWLAHRLFALDRPWLIPFAWAGLEFARSYVPAFAFPWAQLALPLGHTPVLIQHAAYGEIFLISAWLVLSNLAIHEVFFGNRPLIAIRYAMVVSVGVIASMLRFQTPNPGVAKVFGVGQTGVDMAFGSPETQDVDSMRASQLLSTQAALFGAQTLILPEAIARNNGQLPFTPAVPLIYGGTQRGQRGTFQSVFSFEQGQMQRTDKTRLVIFGEYVPFRDQLTFLKGFNLPSGDLVAGTTPRTLSVTGIKFGPTICFESLFPDIPRQHALAGAQVLSVHSVDDWFMGTVAPDVLLLNSAWRAAENGLPLLRSASLGYSGAFDARGNLLVRLPLKRQQAARIEVSVPTKSDAFPYRGWFGPLALVAGLAGAISRQPKAAPSS